MTSFAFEFSLGGDIDRVASKVIDVDIGFGVFVEVEEEAMRE